MDKEENKTRFEKFILPIFTYVGTIGAVLMTLAYILVVCILIFGFNLTQDFRSPLIFAVVNALVGLLVMFFLKVQGISFAKDRNKEFLTEYYASRRKERKYKSIGYYWAISTLKDILIKGLSIAASTFGIIYIVVEGCHDYMLLILAAVNLIMFICFGLLSLANSYDYYNNEHIPFLKNKLEEQIKCLKEMEKSTETSKNRSKRTKQTSKTGKVSTH